jgi:hypothetical protein
MSLTPEKVYDLDGLGDLLRQANSDGVLTVFTTSTRGEAEDNVEAGTIAVQRSTDWTKIGDVFYQLIGSGADPQVAVEVLADHLSIFYSSSAVAVKAVVYGAQGENELLGYLQQIFTLVEEEPGMWIGE